MTMNESLHLVCPHCHRTNRVPAMRVGEDPKCGVCRQSLLPGTPVDLTAANFHRHIEGSDFPVIVDFWAPWCGPCKIMAPAFTQAAKALKTRAQLGKVNTEEETQLAGQYGIRSIPTLIAFKQGREVDRLSGALDADRLVQWVERHL